MIFVRNKFIKVMFGNKGVDFEYKINEINVATVWNPTAETGKDFGGFSYTTEDCILRWLHRGDTVYDVEIPEGAENIKLEGATIIYRTNKIILRNPRKVDDELAIYYYHISNMPERSYYKALGVVAIMNYKNTAMQILRDKVNKENIDEVLGEWNDFMDHGGKNDRREINETVTMITEMLLEKKADISNSIKADDEFGQNDSK